MKRSRSMAGQSWLESSLQRSSKLGLEVLERAKRRSVDWSAARLSTQKHCAKANPSEIQEDPSVCGSLDYAFARLVEHMSETTHQCMKFYTSLSTTKVSEREKSHVCRYHSQQKPLISGRPQPTAMTSKKLYHTALTEPEDFLIEVSPGTYAITAAMEDAGPKTRVVRIKAGESKNLTFTL